jgi:HTH-type transcriptional regulator/antitoxin HigA
MAAVTRRPFTGQVRDDYLELVIKFPLTSIRSDGELDSAQQVMDRLLAQGELSSGETLYLDALSDLIGAYEDDHYAILPASDADMLRHLMEAKEVNQADLHRHTGIAKSTISEVLAGKKHFTRQLIAKLAEFFGVDKGMLAHNL